jgi:hypothetical protein
MTEQGFIRAFDEQGRGMIRPLVGLFYRKHTMEDTYVARTFVARSRRLADQRDCARAGASGVTARIHAPRRRLSGLWHTQPAGA